METTDKELIIGWFNRIAQVADDKKKLNGVVMKDSDAFDHIWCLAHEYIEYVEKHF